jgi:integrase/recombinase XerD
MRTKKTKTAILRNETAINNIQSFRKDLLDNAYSENTAKGYCNDIKLYACWCENVENDNQTLDFLTREYIVGYKDYLKRDMRADAKTINHKLSSLRKYNEFLLDKQKMSSLVIIKKDMCKIQTEFANPTTITDKDVEEFITDIKNDKKYTSLRDYAIVFLLAYTGLRISECLSVQFDDIDWKHKELTVAGKGNKQRTVYLSDKVCKVLNDYLKHNRTKENYGDNINSDYIFISNRSNKLTTSRINQIFDEYNDKIHPHSLRHYFCTHALESDMNLHEIANQAGHSSIQTTMRYTNPTKEAMRSKMNRL